MKKSNPTAGIVYLLIGVGCLLAALLTDSKLDSLLFGFAGAGIIPGIIMLCRYFYWASPRHEKEYSEKLENEQIERRDELNKMLRAKAGQYTYLLGIWVIAIFIPVFAIVDELRLLAVDNLMFMGFLCLYLVFQLLSRNIIYRHLLRKYQ